MIKFLKKHWPLVCIGLLLIVVGFYLVSANKERIKDTLVAETDPEVGVRLKDIHYVQDDPSGGMKWLLDAGELSFSKDRQTLSFKNFKLRLEPPDRPPMELEGERGSYNKVTGDITLFGDLRGKTQDGYGLLTDHILYRKKGQIETDAPVKIIGPFFTVEGKSLYVNLEDGFLRVDGDVTTRVDNKALIL